MNEIDKLYGIYLEDDCFKDTAEMRHLSEKYEKLLEQIPDKKLKHDLSWLQCDENALYLELGFMRGYKKAVRLIMECMKD